MQAFWDRHNRADIDRMKGLLAPLVAASRSRDFADPASARAQVLAFLQGLEDVPPALVEAAVGTIIRRGVTWMPKPGEVKAVCAELRQQARTEAFALALAGCDHPHQFVERVDEAGVTRVARCDCWTRATQAQSQVGDPIARPALPPAPVDVEASA